MTWWKYICIVLILLTTAAGILIPLKPGLHSVSQSSIKTGEQITFTVQGYNTYFEEAKNNRAWLRIGSDYQILASNHTPLSEQLLEVTFSIPPFLPIDKEATATTLIVDNAIDGAMVLPSAVFITQIDDWTPKGIEWWQKNPLENITINDKVSFPNRNILEETIRNLFFHVTLWFAMFLMFLISAIYSLMYLVKGDPMYDTKAYSITQTGIVYGILGLVTGAIWAKFTWGQYWSWDVKQNMTAIAMLIYFAYLILRNSVEDLDQKGRLCAAYNIFSFVAMIPLIFVIPRLTDSLHPGNGGNPGLGSEDLDNNMRMIFYPAIMGWFLLGMWASQLYRRYETIYQKHLEDANQM